MTVPGPAHSPYTIRTATAHDLPAAADVYRATQPPIAEAITAAERDAAIADLQALLARPSDLVVVAEHGDDIVGVGGIVVRERHAHISYLFVHPTGQSRGIGRSLLDALEAHVAKAHADVLSLHASADPRALTRYLRLGLRPMPPTIMMTATAPNFPALDIRDRLVASPLRADDPAQLATVGDIDRAVRGVRRGEDLAAWLHGGAEGALLFRRDTMVPVGYYLVTFAGEEATVGPVAAIDRQRLTAVLGRALHAAGEITGARAKPWRIDLPAENRGAIAPLLDAGFRPRRLMPYLATGTIGQWDRYIFHDDDVL